MIMQGFGVGLITTKMSDLSVIKFSAFTLSLAFYAMVTYLSIYLIIYICVLSERFQI